MERLWHPVWESEKLPEGTCRAVQVLGESILIGRLGGQVYAISNICLHFGNRMFDNDVQALLDDGTFRAYAGDAHINARLEMIDGQPAFRCPYHGICWRGSDGACVQVPQQIPGSPVGLGMRIRSFKTTEKHGLIWLSFVDEPAFPIMDFPELYDENFVTGPIRGYNPHHALPIYHIWDLTPFRFIVATIDDTHFAFTHRNILGDPSDTIPPEKEIWFDEPFLMLRYKIRQPETDVSWGDTEYYWHILPNALHMRKTSPNGNRFVIWFTCCPVDERRMIRYSRIARNYDLDDEHTHLHEVIQDQIEMQDFLTLNGRLEPERLPAFRERLAKPLRGQDAPWIHYQQWLEKLGFLKKGEIIV